MAITLGIDVSSYQDPSGSGDRNLIDWSQVAPTPYDFALARMSIGRGTLDEDGRQNLRAMGGRIPVLGAYGVVGISEPVEDGAKLLVDEIAACGVDPRSILVMLDAEKFGNGSHPSRRQINRYAIQLHTELGTWPHAYVPDWFLDQLAAAGDGDGTVRGLELANCLWVPSEYLPAPWTEDRIRTKRPTNLRGFAGLAWHQFTSSGSVPGITGRVDLNCYYGTLTQLRAQLLGGQEEIDLTKQEFIEAWQQLTAQGIISGQDNWADYFRVAPDRLAKILAQEEANGAALAKLGTLLEAGLKVEVTLDLATASPQQLQDLGSAIGDRLAILGAGYTGTLELTPKTPAT